jgi:mevalonate kinase
MLEARGMEVAVGSAPGKIILLGEHSVVYGEPAIAGAVDRRLTVRARRDAGAEPPHDERLERAIAAACEVAGVDRRGIAIEIESEIPSACGLGSSAALSLALVRALVSLAGGSASRDEVTAGASRVENVFHGTASGLDVATSASEGLIFFERGTPHRVERLAVRSAIEVVIALSGDPRSTAGPVGRLRDRRAKRPDLYGRLFVLAGDLVREGRDAIAREDWEALGELMDTAQGLLNGFGVSTPTLERMIGVARSAGALGAKLSGAGGGGAVVALAPGNAPDVAAALAEAGFTAFASRIGSAPPAGQEVEDAKHRRASA